MITDIRGGAQMKEYSAELQVMGKAVELNHFAEQFLAHTVVGASSSLKGFGEIHTLELQRKDGGITLTVNGSEIELSKFPHDIIDNTLKGLLSSLKDVDLTESYTIKVTC